MIKYIFFIAGIVSLASCTINNKNKLFVKDQSNYEAKIDSILAIMTIDEKIGQMTQVDQQFLDTIQDIADYALGSLLSGGGSNPIPIILKHGQICTTNIKKLLYHLDWVYH